jgi:hypothetical protein
MSEVRSDGSSRRFSNLFSRQVFVATAAAVAVLALGVSALTQVGQKNQGPGVAQGDKQTLPILDARSIAAQSTAAIESAHDVILHVTITGKDIIPADTSVSKRELWLDQKVAGNSLDVAYDAQGTIKSQTAVKVDADTSDHTRAIDAATKTVTEFSNPPSTAHAIPVDLSYRAPTSSSTEVLDGVTTDHFTDVDVDGVKLDVWVAADSKLPVRRIVHAVNGDVVMDFDWAQRTEDNLAKLWPAVPAGYAVENIDEAIKNPSNHTTSTTTPRSAASADNDTDTGNAKPLSNSTTLGARTTMLVH